VIPLRFTSPRRPRREDDSFIAESPRSSCRGSAVEHAVEATFHVGSPAPNILLPHVSG
jgi:hypothetical protein